MWRSTLLWILAFLLTAASAVYQRMTGPTYPIRGHATVADAEVRYRLLRSHQGEGAAEVKFSVPNERFTGVMEWRRFRSHDDWTTQPLAYKVADTRKGPQPTLIARIPHQPMAGKIMYRITLTGPDGRAVALTEEPVIIRFVGGVPEWILIAHIITIFGGMLCSMRTGLEALRRKPRFGGLIIVTLFGLIVGGLILGPVVQKFAFGAFWTGWPFGHDLTDNKTAVAVLAWVLAFWRTRQNERKPGRGWVLGATLVTLAVWLIPHSTWGSELDYTEQPPAATQPMTAPATLPSPR